MVKIFTATIWKLIENSPIYNIVYVVVSETGYCTLLVFLCFLNDWIPEKSTKTSKVQYPVSLTTTSTNIYWTVFNKLPYCCSKYFHHHRLQNTCSMFGNM